MSEPKPPGKVHGFLGVVDADAFACAQGIVCGRGRGKADSVGERIISGVGGQHDFMYGGALSEGGKTFIAIPSTTPKGESKIRALLSPGAGVVTTRHMVQHVVTEYGVADLRGTSIRERVEKLIAVSHPKFREQLTKEAYEIGLVYKKQV